MLSPKRAPGFLPHTGRRGALRRCHAPYPQEIAAVGYRRYGHGNGPPSPYGRIGCSQGLLKVRSPLFGSALLRLRPSLATQFPCGTKETTYDGQKTLPSPPVKRHRQGLGSVFVSLAACTVPLGQDQAFPRPVVRTGHRWLLFSVWDHVPIARRSRRISSRVR